MIEKFVNRENFESDEDFKANLAFTVPEDFNFAYDVIDEWAQKDPSKIALLWCNDFDDELRLDWKMLSDLIMYMRPHLQLYTPCLAKFFQHL